MLQLSRLADYAIVLLAHLMDPVPPTASGLTVWSTRALADAAGLPTTTVAKIMKQLGRHNLVEARRGARGGYRLALPAHRLSVVTILAAMQEPIALTRCSSPTNGGCSLATACPVGRNWQRVNQVVVAALSQLRLADMPSMHRPLNPPPIDQRADHHLPRAGSRPHERMTP